MRLLLIAAIIVSLPDCLLAQKATDFNGLDMNLGNLFRLGLHQVIDGDGHYDVMQRFGMYRWHIADPVRFEKNLRITIQDLGWKTGGRYLVQRSDIAATVFWYQTEPHTAFQALPGRDELDQNY